MDKNRALEIMQTEKSCVERNEANECDRKCEACNLVLPAQEVLEAYDLVIALLSDEPVGEWVHEYDENGLPTFKHKWRCPVCNSTQTYGQPKHCPECGVRLGREETKNDE